MKRFREWSSGERLGDRWEALGVLEGGFSKVYVLYDPIKGEPIAAKTLRREALTSNANQNDEALKCFEKAAEFGQPEAYVALQQTKDNITRRSARQ